MLARTRLSSGGERFRDRPVGIVQAPPGFGKTSLLAQWRHEQPGSRSTDAMTGGVCS
jgi:LuxR family maltose regulon positive regulatory protein